MANFGKLMLCAGLFSLLAAGVIYAQAADTVRGRVKDPSGALISGASVTLKNTATGVTKKSQTDTNGEFSVDGVPPGQYTLQVERPGFTRLIQEITVSSEGAPDLDLTLALSPVSISVEVRASRDELLETLSPGAVSVVYPDDTKGEFKSLPELLDQIPGVYVRRESGSGQYTTASIRGGAPTQVNIYVDGIPFNLASEVAADLSTFPISNVERVEVYRGEVPAQFSGAPVGGAINIVTKTPTSFSLTASAGARTLGGRQFSFALNGPLLRGKLLFGGDLEKSVGDFSYTNFTSQEYQQLILPASSPWGAVPYCQVFGTGGIKDPCAAPIHLTRLNNSFSKDNLLAKWQNDHFSAKWSYLYMNRKMPYGLNQDPQVDNPAAGPDYTVPRYQVLKQTEGVLGWHESYGKLATSLLGNIMDQDKQFHWQNPPEFGYGGDHWWYHTRRYGTEANLLYQVWDRKPVTQRFELHGEWVQETLHAQVAKQIPYNPVTFSGFPPVFRRHTVDFQLQDTITLRFLHNLEITPVGRIERLTGPIVGGVRTPFAKPDGNSGWKPTGSVALKERFGHGWQAYSSYGRYIRYPNFYEIYGDGVYIVPRIDSTGNSIPLQAESGRTVDLGVGWDGALSEKLGGHTRLTFFHRQTDNAITLFQSAAASYYLNSGDTINRGIEFEGSIHRGNFASLQTAATIQDGRYTDQGFFEYGFGAPIFPSAGHKIPTLNTPFGVGDARLDLHFLRGGMLTTFVEAKYVGQNIIGVNTTSIVGGNEGTLFRYDGSTTYERPLTTLDLGIHLKVPHGGTFSSGVTDLLNRSPNQLYGGNVAGDIYADGIQVNWYTCSTTGQKYTTLPPASACPSSDVITNSVVAPVKANVFYPQQGRTVYVLMSWDFGGKRRRAN